MVDQIFQGNLNRFFDDDYWNVGLIGGNRGLGNIPVNIRETERSYEMELFVPGLIKSNFHLKVEGDLLTVSFENKTENKEATSKDIWLRQEYKIQSFSRSFSLSDVIDAAKIAARYENGVLFLELPKKEHAQKISRTVEIK